MNPTAPLLVLLRGINVGPSRQVPMGELRKLLEGAGYGAVRTHLRSGNVLVGTRHDPQEVATDIERLIEARFGFPVAVVVRTAPQLAATVAADPFVGVADDPARQAVAFLSGPPDAEGLAALTARDVAPDRLVVGARELHLWHPNGMADSVLAKELARAKLGVTVTTRNWRTVVRLLAMLPAE